MCVVTHSASGAKISLKKGEQPCREFRNKCPQQQEQGRAGEIAGLQSNAPPEKMIPAKMKAG